MKKVFAFALAMAMTLGLASCGSENSPADSGGSAASGGADVSSSAASSEPLDFPTKTIEVVVPYSAGGGLDAVTRFAAEALDLPQSVTITNMVGGSSLVAVMDVAGGDQSGHRIVAHHPESMSAYYLGGVFDQDYGSEFNWVCSYAYDSMCIAVGKDSKINNWEELVADAKSRPGEQTWGGSGNLSTNHMAAAIAMKRGDFLANYVPYSGAADARIACIGGNLDVFIGQTSEMVAYAESGDLKIICTWTEERTEWMPDVPTFTECVNSTDGTVYGLHRGVMAPKGVPENVRQFLEDAYKAACTDPQWEADVSANLHYEPTFCTGTECLEISQEAYAIAEEAVEFINNNLS